MPQGRDGDRRPSRSWVWPLVAVAAVLAVLAGITVPRLMQAYRPPTVAQDPAIRVPVPIPSSSASPSPSGPSVSGAPAEASTAGSPATAPEPTAGSARAESVGVYYLAPSVQRTEVGARTDRVRLYRESHRLPVGATPLAKVAGAVTAMASIPPVDPDYRTAWTTIGSVQVTEVDGGLQVDLGADGFPAGLPDSFTAVQAIQQLVWTATAAYGRNVAVRVLVDGGTNVSWGRGLFGTSVSRDPSLQAPVWILDPVTADRDTAGKVRVSGISTAAEATVGWQIHQARSGDLVAEGTASGGANGQYARFAFDVELRPGHYAVMVYAPDLSGANPLGEGDSKTWYVR